VQVQVIVATQSLDLLDREDPGLSAVRAVSIDDGRTVIGEIDRASQQIVRDNVYTLGGPMRGNQLSPETAPDAQSVVPES
jgi:hypothetical protein